MESVMEKFVSSVVVRDSLALLGDGVTFQFFVNGTSYEVLKEAGEIHATQKETKRPYVIFWARPTDLEALGSAKDSKEFGARFAEMYLAGSVDMRFMAQPGRLVDKGVFTALIRMGIKPNLI